MKPKIFALVFLLASLAACKDSFLFPDDVSPDGWKPVVAVPLVFGDLDVYDMLEYSQSPDNILINNNNMVELIYDGRLFSYDATNAYQIPDQIWQGSYTIPPSGIPSVDQLVDVDIEQSFVYALQTPGDASNDPIQLAELVFEDGLLQLQFSSNVNMTFTGSISIPQLIDGNGNAFITPINMIPGQSFGMVIDLQNYALVMDPVNTLEIFLAGTTTVNALDVIGGAEIAFSFEAEDLAFRSLRGYLGQIEIANDRDSIFIDIFRNTVQGYFQLMNPTLRLHVENSIGLPCRIFFDDLQTVNLNTGETFPMIGPGFSNPLDIAYPLAMNQTSITDVLMNNQNSNIQSLLNPAPKILYTQIHAQTNPDGNTGEMNFITNQSKFSMDVDLSLPLNGYANLIFRDTLPIDISETATPEEVERIELRHRFTNCFPFETRAQVYLLDENYLVLDSLFTADELVLPLAQIADNGDLIQSGQASFDVVMDGPRADLLFATKYVSIVARGITENYDQQKVIAIRSNQKISFTIGAKVFTNLSEIE